MFYYKEYQNPVTGEFERNIIKVLPSGSFISFAADNGPLVDEYNAWVAEGNVATEWGA